MAAVLVEHATKIGICNTAAHRLQAILIECFELD